MVLNKNILVIKTNMKSQYFSPKKECLMNITTLLFLNLLMVTGAYASFAPSKLYLGHAYQLDSKFAHHLFVAEKSTHKMHVFANNNGTPKLVRTFDMASGEIPGDKMFQGDKKTPEGIYFMTRFHSGTELVRKYGKEGEIYGEGAFVLNYPNTLDYRRGKTGGGIWIHSTNDDSRVDKGLVSRGCLVLGKNNKDIRELSKYIELQKTPVIIVQDLHYLTEQTWTVNKKKTLKFLTDWKNAWENENFKNYISHYHPQEFRDHYRGNYKQFKKYKRAVFNNPGKPQITLNNVSILNFDTYSMVVFEQNYKSNKINDIGKKVLFLKKDGYNNWKIVAEQWHQLKNETNLVFMPSNRFFTPQKEAIN